MSEYVDSGTVSPARAALRSKIDMRGGATRAARAGVGLMNADAAASARHATVARILILTQPQPAGLFDDLLEHDDFIQCEFRFLGGA